MKLLDVGDTIYASNQSEIDNTVTIGASVDTVIRVKNYEKLSFKTPISELNLIHEKQTYYIFMSCHVEVRNRVLR